jgi:nucleoside-diphosphate-sugar epimerase
MNKRILVTGANGFLGQAFVRSISTSTADVLPMGGGKLGYLGAGEHSLDITDKARVRAVLREFQPTHVFNFASRGVTRDHSALPDLLNVNTIGALNIVEGLIEEGLTPRAFFFGTAYEYADSDERLDEIAPLDPKSPYAISKSALYYALKQYQSDAPLHLLRLFNVFGTGEPAERLIPFIVRKAISHEPVPLTPGEQLRDFMFIDDLISILVRLAAIPENDRCGLKTLNIGTGEGITLKNFIGHISTSLLRCGIKAELQFGALPYRPQDPMRCVANNTRLLKLLGDINFINLDIAVDKTVQALLK